MKVQRHQTDEVGDVSIVPAPTGWYALHYLGEDRGFWHEPIIAFCVEVIGKGTEADFNFWVQAIPVDNDDSESRDRLLTPSGAVLFMSEAYFDNEAEALEYVVQTTANKGASE